jgi:LPXTG-site transpeptidase (sortase) family protein
VRRRIGYVLFVVGGLLLSFAGSRYAVGMLRADAARRSWNDATAREAVALVQAAASHGWSTERIASGAPIARIVIPSIDLDEIVLEGVDDDALNAGPGHLPGSAFPGSRGNSVISAHRDRHFNRLDGISVGDTIRTESGRHAVTWVVVSKRIIGRDKPALFATKDPTLTLTTCWPIRYVGSAPDRLILTAKPVTGTPMPKRVAEAPASTQGQQPQRAGSGE